MTIGKLKMQQLDSNLSVYVDFWNKNEFRYNTGLFTFDTGASVTTISKDILFGLGYNVIDGTARKITTASNIEYVREVYVDKIYLGGHELENVMVYAHTFPEESLTTGVIGLNILSKFDIELLFSKQLIKLTRIKTHY